ncbi:MAG TPA: PAS domain S-box protein [Chloroflexia bacterium]|nr:PAS domain S-box protein [Chloroflexia bacterium]
MSGYFKNSPTPDLCGNGHEEQFQLLIEHVKDTAIFMLDREGYVSSWNSGASRLSGYQAEEIIGQPFSRFYQQEEQSQQDLKRAAEAGKLERESWLFRQSGARFKAELVISALSDKAGELSGFAVIIKDISEQKNPPEPVYKLNSELEQRLWMLERALEASTAGIIITDPNQPDEPIIYANAGFEQLTGYASQEVLGKNCRFLQGHDFDQPELDRVRQSLAEETDCRVLLRNYRKDGTLFWNELTISPVHDNQGRLINRIGIQTDITPQVQAEEALRYRLAFEKLIATISTNFINMKLSDIDRGINQALKLIGEFAGVDRAYVTLYESGEIKAIDYIYEWTAAVANPYTGARLAVPVDKHSWGVGKLLRFEHIRIPRVADMPPEAENEKRNFERFGVRSNLAVPLVYQGELRGSIGFSSLSKEIDWTEDNLTSLKVLGEILVNALERKRMEEELRKNEELYQTLAVNLPNGIVYLFDKELRYTLVEGAALSRTRFSKKELEGKTLWEVLPPPYVQKYTPLYQAALDGTTSSFEESYGEYTYWITILPVRNKLGEIFAGMVVSYDISERKQVEEALRLSEARLAGIINSATDAIISLDARQKIVVFNTAAEKMFGCTAGEVLGTTIQQFLPQRVNREHGSYIEEFRQSDAAVRTMGTQAPLTAVRKNGEEFPIEATISRVENGGQMIYTTSIRDITGRKQAEEALARSEAQLRQAQKMEAVGRLAGGIAHDFNNLLTAIIGYTDLTLGSVSETDPLWEDLDEIRKAAERASTLTRQLLAFSRQQVLQTKILDVNTVVSEMYRLLTRLIGEDVKLELDLDPSEGKIKADQGQLEQVVINLAVNARDAMPEGGVLRLKTARVTLSKEAVQQYEDIRPGRYILLTMQDSGMGMAEETVKHIFEPFFTTKEPGHGTGLGLATVYGIVRQSGGFIEVQSRTGEGTSFYIYLPEVEEQEIELNAQSAITRPLEGSGETVLLVEDEESVRTLVSKLLSNYGYEVLEAHNGAEALLICDTHPGKIDLMITDMIMPHMNGRQLAERLQQLKPAMKVLYMSGYTDRIMVPEELEEIRFNFLQKPFSFVDLARKVREILDSPGSTPGSS